MIGLSGLGLSKKPGLASRQRTVPRRSSSGGILPSGLRPADRIARHGRLAASDTVLTLSHGDAEAWQYLKKRLEPKLGSRWPMVEQELRPLFDSGLIKPLISGLTRGEEWSAPIMIDGIEIGTVSLDALLAEDSFADDGLPARTTEFEDGTEALARVGELREDRLRLTGGIVVKGKGGGHQYSATPSGYAQWLRLTQAEHGSRMVAKTKTVEPGIVFTGQVELGVRTHFHADPAGPRRDPADLTVEVVLPEAETRDAQGELRKPVTEHWAPPRRITESRRFGSTDAIWDLYLLPRDGPAVAPPGERPLRQSMAEWIEEISAEGEEVFGKDLWDKVADRSAGRCSRARSSND